MDHRAKTPRAEPPDVLVPPSHQREAIQTGNPRGTTVEKSPGICGGEARIAGTRIPIWQLVEARDLGVPDSQLLIDFPRLTSRNLTDAWSYAEENSEEIAAAIRDNEVA
jgi:uncharacterized protein (DUF433 family)